MFTKTVAPQEVSKAAVLGDGIRWRRLTTILPGVDAGWEMVHLEADGSSGTN